MLRFLKVLVISLLSIILLGIALLYITNHEYLLKGIRLTYLRGYTSASIDDWQYFNTRTVEKGLEKPWNLAVQEDNEELSEHLRAKLEELESVAFLVIKDDSIRYEEYWHNYTEDDRVNSFSMAKSITTTLLHLAIKDGYIKGLSQAVGDFLPSFRDGKNANLSVAHLARMCADLSWQEHYTSPFSITAKSYYGEDLEGILTDLSVEEPGKEYLYQSGATALLGLVIREAVGKPLSTYAAEKLWQPLGATQDAYWMLDKEDGLEKAYCCFASTARDFARMGKLFLNHGNFDGVQIVDSSWVDLVSHPDLVNYYSYGWWIHEKDNRKVFYMRWILGQYVFVIPELNTVVVRLGKKRGPKVDGTHPAEVSHIIDEMYNWYGK